MRQVPVRARSQLRERSGPTASERQYTTSLAMTRHRLRAESQLGTAMERLKRSTASGPTEVRETRNTSPGHGIRQRAAATAPEP